MSSYPWGKPWDQPTVSIQRREVEAKISEALQQLKLHGVRTDVCPRCNSRTWSADILEIPAKSLVAAAPNPPLPPPYFHTGETTLNVLALVCSRCGNTFFHNLAVLGVEL